MFGTVTAAFVIGELSLPVEEVTNIQFVDQCPSTSGTRASAFFPFDITGGFKAESPVADLVSQSLGHMHAIPFLEIDDDLDDKVSDFVRASYRDTTIRKLTKRV